jgi:acetyltransferase
MLGLSQRIAHEQLVQMCFIDYDRQMALVVNYHNPQTEQDEIIGVGRLIKAYGDNEAEFAILVTDQFQRKGLGTELLRRLIQFGHDEKLQRLTGNILAENRDMQEICKKLGFQLQHTSDARLMSAELEL